MNDIAKRLSGLSPERRKLFAELLEQKGAAYNTYPLSSAQRRFWFIEQLDPGNPAYNIPGLILLNGALVVAALERSLREIVRRHSALRTVFINVEGKPMQVVRQSVELELPIIDLQHHPAEARLAEAQRHAEAATRQPFDLEQGPLLRAQLLRLADDQHMLLLTTHHIVFDGSIGEFLRELSALYNAFVVGADSPLPELSYQYTDFALWQREWLQGERLDRLAGYWQEHLGAQPAPTILPTDCQRSAFQLNRGATHPFLVEAGLAEGLRRLSQREGVTLFMLGLAAFAALLYHYTDQDELILGTPIPNRSQPGAQGLIGSFINTVVLRLDLGGAPSLRTLLERVRDATLGAYDHQDLPFEKLVELIHPERGLNETPLFRMMFVLHPRSPASFLQLNGLETRVLPVATGRSRFDMLFGLSDGPEGLAGSIEYSSDLFEAETIARLERHYLAVLRAMCDSLDQPLPGLAVLTPAERDQIIVGWNDTAAPFPAERCINQLFEEQVARTPDALAVSGPRGRLSYAQLNRRANQIARQLRQCGVRPGTLVGVFMERCEQIPAALLGILKAGGAYVPIETHLPAARIVRLVDSLGLRYLLSTDAQRATLDPLLGEMPSLEQIVCLDAANTPSSTGAVRWCGAAEIARQPEINPPQQAAPEDLAYVIFTSGSTGTPKGVMVQHRPVINLISWLRQTFGLGPHDQVLFVTALSFDLSVYDIFGTLAMGASIRVAEESDLRDPARLLHILEHEPITFWDSAPAMLQQLAPLLEQRGRGSRALRLVFLSGDWIPVSLPDQVRAAFPAAQVVSLGGATEATVWSNYYPIARVAPNWASIPYGRPMQNAQYYVLDTRLQPRPIGVPGDLYIGGECLAAGYINAPELTAAKFIPHPFSHVPGARLYRTGDRARYWADGTIEFLGRLDHQVKIRGYRIELGEIEALLLQHQAVREAVVLLGAGATGDKRLVAYVTLRAGQQTTSAELRQHLRAQLPEYMLPAALLVLDALPLTPNGKLDRAALPQPEALRTEEAGYAAPTTPTEQTIAAIWEEVVGVKHPGIHESFFDIGGHSLMATQVIARIEGAFDIRLSVRDLFSAPTIHGVAQLVEESILARADDADLERMLALVEGMDESQAQRALASGAPWSAS